MYLFALVGAPWCGVTEDAPGVAHRVNVEGLPHADEWSAARSVNAVCGEPVRLVDIRWRDLRTRGTPFTRCRTCRCAS